MIKGDNEVNVFAKILAHAKSINIEVLKPRTEVDFFTAEGLGIVNVPPRSRLISYHYVNDERVRRYKNEFKVGPCAK